MRRREYHWSVYHVTEKNQIDHLRTDQAEAIYAAIPSLQRREWFIWKEGLDSWKPFEDFPELVKSLRKADDRVFEQPPALPGSVTVSQPAIMTDVMEDTLGGSIILGPVHDLIAPPPEQTRVASKMPATGNVKAGAKPGAKLRSEPHPSAMPAAAKAAAASSASAAASGSGSAKAAALTQKAAPVQTNPVQSSASARQTIKPGQSKPPTSAAQGGPAQKVSLSHDDEESSIELSLMKVGVAEDRNNMRFDRSLDVRIFVGEQVFLNKTSNISLKGMQLAQDLPKSLPRYFNVEIGRGDRLIPVVCSEVRSKSGGPSTRLKIESNEHASAMLTMLLSST